MEIGVIGEEDQMMARRRKARLEGKMLFYYCGVRDMLIEINAKVKVELA